jgi:hypothetical protein
MPSFRTKSFIARAALACWRERCGHVSSQAVRLVVLLTVPTISTAACTPRECKSDTECYSRALGGEGRGRCHRSGVCVACLADTDCSPEYPHCVGGSDGLNPIVQHTCVQCRSKSDCVGTGPQVCGSFGSCMDDFDAAVPDAAQPNPLTVLASSNTIKNALGISASSFSYLSVSSGYVYWASSAGILRVPSSGGSPSRVTPLDNGVSCLYADATSVYWWDGSNRVMRVPVIGGTPVPVASLSSTMSTFSCAFSGGYAYGATSDNQVVRVELATGAVVAIATGDSLGVVGAAALRVAWTRLSASGSWQVAARVGTGSATTVSKEYPDISGLAVLPTSLYWITSGSSAAVYALVDGYPEASIVEGLYFPQVIGTDGLRLYWVSGSDWGIWSTPVPVNNPQPRTPDKVVGSGGGRHIAFDDSFVYSTGDYELVRVPKL